MRHDFQAVDPADTDAVWECTRCGALTFSVWRAIWQTIRGKCRG